MTIAKLASNGPEIYFYVNKRNKTMLVHVETQNLGLCKSICGLYIFVCKKIQLVIQ